MESVSNNTHVSLFGGADELAAKLLDIPSVRHWSALRKLDKPPHHDFGASSFVSALFDHFDGNWNRCQQSTARAPSAQNWRWFHPVGEIAQHNRSPEVTLERAIVRAALARSREDWSNQVPIASGIGAGSGNRRRAIDLVRYTASGELELVELKIGSDNPLFAAIEILQYGFVWLLSRRDQKALGYLEKRLLQASNVKLSVLAPSAYYSDLNLDWLAQGLSEGIRTLGESAGVRMSFVFEEFSDDFSWPTNTEVDVLDALDGKIVRADRPKLSTAKGQSTVRPLASLTGKEWLEMIERQEEGLDAAMAGKEYPGEASFERALNYARQQKKTES